VAGAAATDRPRTPGADGPVGGHLPPQRDLFAAALTRHFGGLASWETPAGGLFFWLKLHQAIDTRALLPLAIDAGVAFMPGEAFYPDDPAATGTLRLNFSHAGEADIDRGLATLAGLCASHMAMG
jgi:DNA-binding transcriptional MocR family regulator